MIYQYFNESKSLNFYRLLQECLTNIVKHAKAKSVSVNIKIEDKRILTLISDNGKGFNVVESKKKNSLGLKTIFERIKIMNGNISVDSELNKGTSFIFSRSRLNTFSTSIMASSTNAPIAIAIPPKLIVFIV